MDINISLLIQALSFGIFLWLTKKLVLPPLQQILEKRVQKIEAGLLAADAAAQELEQAQMHKDEIVNAARKQAQQIMLRAKEQAKAIISQSNVNASKEREIILAKGREKLEHEQATAKEKLYVQTVKLATDMAEKILKRTIAIKDQQRFIHDLGEDILNR